jgi:hypothetical protein
MTKTYDKLNSSAISSITIEDNVVKVVYNTNKDKEYTFDCKDTEQFQQQLSEELIDVELNNGKGSVGRFLHQQVRDGALVQSK